MPVVESAFQPPFLLKNGHLQTVVPSLFRKVTGVNYTRERIETPDDDFLDLDWSRVGERRLVIVSHGLEGSADRHYMRGMVKEANHCGWDALAWNFRGCSGETNRKLYSYHSGATADLATVIEHVLSDGYYQQVALTGFSLGGNMTLKYLGECGQNIPEAIVAAVAFSVPCDLATSAAKMSSLINRPYMMRFMRYLHIKIKEKMEMFPGEIDDHNYHEMKTFADFDGRYTAPLNGFTSAEDYWEKCSSKPFMPYISIPTLLVNAKNDSFLSAACFPFAEAEQNPNFFLEIPVSGGHVGFIHKNKQERFWAEKRALAFINAVVNQEKQILASIL